ncbi:MAG: type IV pilin protein [Gammaproteobacteria bacterium]|nr:type IV pilin protein [Pseudomonadales bacterium]MCP5345679.1 type IV pilin protein [Pseudomonadales bacterium]
MSNKQSNRFAAGRQQGYTLIEILIVVAILGILAAVAIPSYQNSVLTSNRSVAHAALLDLANRQEQFYLDNRTYSTDLTDLGYPAAMVFSNSGSSAVAINDNHSLVASTSTERLYFVQIDAGNATTFALSAVPQLTQAGDSECGTLGLSSTGVKAETGSGSVSDCW